MSKVPLMTKPTFNSIKLTFAFNTQSNKLVWQEAQKNLVADLQTLIKAYPQVAENSHLKFILFDNNNIALYHNETKYLVASVCGVARTQEKINIEYAKTFTSMDGKNLADDKSVPYSAIRDGFPYINSSTHEFCGSFILFELYSQNFTTTDEEKDTHFMFWNFICLMLLHFKAARLTWVESGGTVKSKQHTWFRLYQALDSGNENVKLVILKALAKKINHFLSLFNFWKKANIQILIDCVTSKYSALSSLVKERFDKCDWATKRFSKKGFGLNLVIAKSYVGQAPKINLPELDML